MQPNNRILDPRWMLGIIFSIFTLRWIWIAGLGDYGLSYEGGMRILAGEIPYRDTITTLPQLTSYSIIPFLIAFKGNLFSFAFHLYAWWLFALIAGLQVAKELGCDRTLRTAALFLGACISFPALSHANAYNYASTAFAGFAMCFNLRALASGKLRDAFISGVFIGLTIFAKQNVGAAAFAVGGAVFAYEALVKRSFIPTLKLGLVYSVGCLGAFLPVFFYFAAHAGLHETFLQMFSDASAAKGGMKGMLQKGLPIIFFQPGTPHRHFWDLAVSGFVFAFWLALISLRLRRQPQSPTPDDETNQRNSNNWFLIGLLTVAAISLISIVNIPVLKSLFNSLRTAYFPHNYLLFLYALYVGWCTLFLTFLLRLESWRSKQIVFSLLWLAVFILVFATSGFWYFVFSAPVAVPISFYLLRHLNLIRSGHAFAVTIGTASVVVFSIFPTQCMSGALVPTFEALDRLPSQTHFAGLYAGRSFAVQVRERLEFISPRIGNQRTLWLAIPGPFLAFGGAPVRNIPALYHDTYNPRNESPLKEEWERHPPEFVVLESFHPNNNAKFLTPQYLTTWLTNSYDLILQEKTSHASLWHYRASTNSPPPTIVSSLRE